jgi:hypothetical protein
MSPGQVLGGTTIQLGSVLLGVVDAQNVHWTIDPDGLQGWDSPEVRYSSTDREGDHGAWVGPTYLGPRPVTITGKIEAPDGPTLDAAKEVLLAACSLTDTTLVVNESLSLQATVRRSGKPIVTKITDSLASYSLLVTAADPRRYDVNLQTQSTALNSSSGGLTFPVTFPITFSATSVAGAISAANAGSMDTRPVFTVTGPATAPQIITRYPDGTTRTLSYSALAGGLAAGEQLVIDTDRHTVLSGGASRRRWISGDWPTIPANTTVLFQFRDTPYNAASLLTASWRSAWM